MDILFLLVPLSLLLVAVIAVVFWRAVQGGQFEDLEGPAHQILLDDDASGCGEPRAARYTRFPHSI